MKIKQILNDKINSFEFNFDLFNTHVFEKVLQLFKIDRIYMTVYGLLSNNEVIERCKCIVNKYFIIDENRGIFNVIFDLDVKNLEILFSIIGKDMDELMVWSRDRSWETYIADEYQQPKFFSFQKSNIKMVNKFCLDFEPYENYKINIYCDSTFELGMKVAKGDLENILQQIIY